MRTLIVFVIVVLVAYAGWGVTCVSNGNGWGVCNQKLIDFVRPPAAPPSVPK